MDSANTLVVVDWQPSSSPLPAIAAAARGDAARRLAERLLRDPTERLERLAGVAGRALLVVTGAIDDLPWVDGVVYLGRTPDAPALLLPTTHVPSCHPALLERALLRRTGQQPLAVLLDPPLVVPLTHARRLDAAALARWLSETTTRA